MFHGSVGVFLEYGKKMSASTFQLERGANG